MNDDLELLKEKEEQPATSKLVYPTDCLRTPINMGAADVRNHYIGVTSVETLFNEIELFKLDSKVPEDIATQYDTARNLYLYAFHVYRFYNIAQQQLYSVLELSIKECIGEEKLKKYIKSKQRNGRGPRAGLSIYMQYLKDHQLIVNSDFPMWHNRNKLEAENVYREKISKLMEEKNLQEYEWDDSEIDESQFDVKWDYVAMLCKTLPGIRNSFAHGSKSLYNDVLRYFQDISIIINNMYQRNIDKGC